MMRFDFLLSARREYSRRARLFVALLALLQFIAPTWHVCEMGGGATCSECPTSTPDIHSSTSATQLHCPAIQAAPHCPRCWRAQNAASTRFSVRAADSPADENCLAKLLQAMPWQTAATPTLLKYSSLRHRFFAREYIFQSAFSSALPPSRGPPLFS